VVPDCTDSWLPMIFLIGVFVFFMRQMQAGGGRGHELRKSRLGLITEAPNRITFQDVAGVEEAKEELREVNRVSSKTPKKKKFTRLGGKIPKGVLLMGARAPVKSPC